MSIFREPTSETSRDHLPALRDRLPTATGRLAVTTLTLAEAADLLKISTDALLRKARASAMARDASIPVLPTDHNAGV